MVGLCLWYDDVIIGEGYHQLFGGRMQKLIVLTV